MSIVLIICGIVLFLALIYGPQYWVTRVLDQYSNQQDHYPGTGGELAEHLIRKFELQDVNVEKSESGDHYDPVQKTVRLTEDKLNGKSLTAITVAAHEVGHAIQHHTGYKPFKLRHYLAIFAIGAQKLGALMMILIPVLGLISRSPQVGLVIFLVGISGMILGTIVHLVTLPVEWDASFKRALPILQAGEYISVEEQKHAKRILTAAALTYVSGSLASLLNLARWIAILRR
jgi:Zn-dependent membrane protease YugP